MATFEFVTVTKPDEIKQKGHQNAVRSHAIRASIKKKRKEAMQTRSNFVVVDLGPHGPGQNKRTSITKEKKSSVVKSLSSSRLDPFDSLPTSPERLRRLMRHRASKCEGEPVLCVNDAGKMLFQGVEMVFQSTLTDPALFHALSLVLASAANNYMSTTQCLIHRGEILNNLGKRMGNPDMISEVSTLTAMLLLIGFEYRIDGVAAKNNISMHIKAADEVLRIGQGVGSFLNSAIRRALFWQDLFGSMMVGTSRLLSHEQFPELCWGVDSDRSAHYVIPSGFCGVMSRFPPAFGEVLEDLNALCSLIDEYCGSGKTSIYELRVEDGQAWIESRLADLFTAHRDSGAKDPVYEACIFAVFLCTYKLSTVIWEGCYISEWLASKVVEGLSQIADTALSGVSPELLLWLLFVGGALGQRKTTRLHCSLLIHTKHHGRLWGLHSDWASMRTLLKKFVWSQFVLEQEFRPFWEELHPGVKTSPNEGAYEARILEIKEEMG